MIVQTWTLMVNVVQFRLEVVQLLFVYRLEICRNASNEDERLQPEDEHLVESTLSTIDVLNRKERINLQVHVLNELHYLDNDKKEVDKYL